MPCSTTVLSWCCGYDVRLGWRKDGVSMALLTHISLPLITHTHLLRLGLVTTFMGLYPRHCTTAATFTW